MPFDILPSHHIVLPQVQFYHPSPALAQLAVESAWKRHDALMQSLGAILNAADPETIAKRRLSMMQTAYESKMLPLELSHIQKYGFGLPKTPQEAIAQQNWINQNRSAGFFNDAKGATMGTGPYGPTGTTTTVTVGAPEEGGVQTTVDPTQIGAKPPPLPQTITGGRVTDEEGNLLPPEKQGVPPPAGDTGT